MKPILGTVLPIFGHNGFRFDMFGHNGYVYCLIVLFVFAGAGLHLSELIQFAPAVLAATLRLRVGLLRN